MGIAWSQMRNDVAQYGQSMRVVFSKVVGHAGFARMEIAAAQIFRADLFARGGFDERRAREEDGALFAHDDRFIAHCRDIGAAGGAASQNAGDLRYAFAGHIGLIVEYLAEMVPVRKDFGLMRQIGAAGIHQIQARQTIGLGDFLRPQMLLDGHGKISAALYRRVVCDNHTGSAGNTANAGDQAGAGRFIPIQSISSQLTEFKKGRAGVQQTLYALSRQELTPPNMLGAGTFRAAQCCDFNARTKLGR